MGASSDSAGIPTYTEIIVPLVGSPAAELAVPVARWLGGLLAAPLTLVNQVPSLAHRESAVDYLQGVADGIGRLDTEHVVVEAGRAADALVDFAAKRPDALVVMETHGRSPLGQMMLGSVSVEVVRRSTLPVVMVGPRSQEPDQDAGVTRVVVCLDGADEAERALAPAIRAARSFGARLTLMQTHPRGTVSASPAGDVSEAAYLQSLAVGIDDEIVVDWEVVAADDPSEGIVELIGGDANSLLVLATRARRIGKQFRHGSVALDVVGGSSSPVMVVGPSVPA